MADTEIETVEMTDGRKVDFVGKRKLLKTSTIDRENEIVTVRFDFRNGETRLITLPEELILDFAAHGAEQKYGDETAGVQDIDDMVLAIDELDTNIQAGKWSTRREGSGMAGTSILLRALVELTGKSVEEVKATLSGLSQADKLALRGASKLKPIIERLEAEKASKGAKVDTDALLAAF
jgi:hypothetical protein